MSNASWMTMLSELTLGAGAGTLHAEVRADVSSLRAKRWRLVVQTYEPQARRPLGSIQRAVTPDELQRGVSVVVPHVAAPSPPRMIAWVERGAPDLEHDGLTARPARGSFVGFGDGDDARIRLSRR